MLTCQELTELITDYLEGRMSLWDRIRFRLHLGMCGHCRAFLEDRCKVVHTASEALPASVAAEAGGLKAASKLL